jgi:ABC-type branched-subunit amino acid transport system ATPase component
VSLLEVEGLEAGYGPVTVVRDLSFEVEEGKVVTILGANGAGKTTTLRALSGVARGLMLRPRLMLLDEPSHGLSPLITREVFKILREVAEEGTTLLIVEQNANLVLDFADHAYVLETGRLVLDGTAEQISADEGVRRSYLGMV